MTEQLFYIDIEDSSGNRLGSGPVLGASGWEYTGRQDRAGAFRFAVPATTAQASVITKKRVARAWAWLDGTWTEVGAGIIDSIVRRPQADGTVLLDVSGDDLLRELTYRSVKDLKLYTGGNPVTHSAAVAAVAAYAPAGWTLTPDGSPPNDSIYGRFNGETVLAAAIKIADKTQNHFYRGAGRGLVFASAFTDSGLRAIQAGPGDLAAETCAITRLSKTTESYDLITRIYPRGSGNGDVQLTLKATTRSAPAGYTLDAANNYIDNDAAQASYGVIEQFVEWRDIGPIANTAADIQAAADMLFDAALAELARRSAEAEADYYDLDVAGCSALLRPMQTIRLVWRDPDADIDVDAMLNILETTWRVDASGVQTTALRVTTADRWPTDDTGAMVDSITQGQIYQALPQLNANSYVTAYRGNVDGDQSAAFRFRFGAEVAQLQQVLVEFQLLPFESTVRSVGGESISTGSGGGATPTSSSGGGSSPTTSSGGGTTVSSASGGSSSPTSSAETSHTHTVTVPSHTHSVTIGDHTHSVTIANHTHTVTISSHTHGLHVYNTGDFTPVTLETLYYAQAEDVLFSNSGAGGGTATTQSGGGSTPTTSNGGGSTPTTSSGGGTTVSSASGGGTTPTSSAGSSHSHTVTIAAHTHSVTIANHTHTVTISSHTHTVTVPNHTHSVTPVINPIYGIFRQSTANTLVIDELQYRVNGGSWLDADTAANAGDGWYQLDITDDVMDADTFRPIQANNLIEFRSIDLEFDIVSIAGYSDPADLVAAIITAPSGPPTVGGTIVVAGTTYYDGRWVVTEVNWAGGDGWEVLWEIPGNTTITMVYTGTVTVDKTVTIDAQLSVRNIIQAIAYV